MKSTGIVRKIDELGRIVIPSEIRHTFRLKPKDSLVLFIDGNNIIFRKLIRSCDNCGEEDNNLLSTFGRLTLCKKCIKMIKKG